MEAEKNSRQEEGEIAAAAAADAADADNNDNADSDTDAGAKANATNADAEAQNGVDETDDEGKSIKKEGETAAAADADADKNDAAASDADADKNADEEEVEGGSSKKEGELGAATVSTLAPVTEEAEALTPAAPAAPTEAPGTESTAALAAPTDALPKTVTTAASVPLVGSGKEKVNAMEHQGESTKKNEEIEATYISQFNIQPVEGQTSCPPHTEVFNWEKLLSHMQTNARHAGFSVHTTIIDNVDDANNFLQLCEGSVDQKLIACLVRSDSTTSFENSHVGLLCGYKPYWGSSYFVYEDGGNAVDPKPPQLKRLDESIGTSSKLYTIRKEKSVYCDSFNSFDFVWRRINEWPSYGEEMMYRIRLSFYRSMLKDYHVRFSQRMEGTGWRVLNAPLESNGVKGGKYYDTSYSLQQGYHTLESLQLIVSQSHETNIICICLDEGDNNETPRVSFMAIVRDKKSVVWCDVLGETYFQENTSQAAAEFAISMSYTLNKTTVYRPEWQEQSNVRWKSVQSFNHMRLLLKSNRWRYLKRCMDRVKTLNEGSVSNTTTQGTSYTTTTPVATTATTGVTAAAAAVSNTAAVSGTAAASDAAATSAITADGAPTRKILDANKISTKDWSPLTAACCLPCTIATLEVVHTVSDFPLILHRPHDVRWFTPPECPGVSCTQSCILSEIFQLQLKEMLWLYYEGCIRKGEKGAVDGTMIFNTSLTDENQGKWEWLFAGEINYTSLNGSNRDKSTKEETKRLGWSKVTHLKHFLAFLDFTARFALTASGELENGTALKHGRLQQLFWDRAEINVHRTNSKKPIKPEAGHVLVHFIIGGNCTFKFHLGNGNSKKAKLGLHAGDVCLVTGKTRWNALQEITFPPDPSDNKSFAVSGIPILVTLYYVIVTPTVSRKLQAVEDEILPTELVEEADSCIGGGETVLYNRMQELITAHIAEEDATKKGRTGSRKSKRKREDVLCSNISADFKLRLPGIDAELKGEVRGTSTTYVNYFDPASGSTLKCGLQVWQALQHTQHQRFIGFGLPFVLKPTYRAAKYCSAGFTAVFAGFVVWPKNSQVHILCTLVHNEDENKDFMVTSTLQTLLSWQSQESSYQWKSSRFPDAALKMKDAWVAAMDKHLKKKSSLTVDTQIPVKNIGTAPVEAAIVKTRSKVVRKKKLVIPARATQGEPLTLVVKRSTQSAENNAELALMGAPTSPIAPPLNIVQNQLQLLLTQAMTMQAFQQAQTVPQQAQADQQAEAVRLALQNQQEQAAATNLLKQNLLLTQCAVKETAAVKKSEIEAKDKELELTKNFNAQIVQMLKEQAAEKKTEVAALKKICEESTKNTERRLDVMTKTAVQQLSYPVLDHNRTALTAAPAPVPVLTGGPSPSIQQGNNSVKDTVKV